MTPEQLAEIRTHGNNMCGLQDRKLLLTAYDELQQALVRAVTQHGHHYQCSAVRGMERDCHCGWLEVKALASQADVAECSNSSNKKGVKS